MNRKKSSDLDLKKNESANTKSFIQELKEDLGPAYERKAEKFKGYVKANPRRVLIWMFSFVIVNIGVLFFFTRQYKTNSFHYTDLKLKHDGSAKVDQVPDIPFTWDNYSKMSSIKDTLEYLMNKPQLSQQDTLTFMRIATEIEKLDPAFIKKIKQQPR
ncbi:MAG: hypothetical protein RIS73_109 [Bacteroidota bacterium]